MNRFFGWLTVDSLLVAAMVWCDAPNGVLFFAVAWNVAGYWQGLSSPRRAQQLGTPGEPNG